MGLFSKTELVEAILPFKIQKLPIGYDGEFEIGELGGLIDFEAYGRVGELCENKYFYAMVGCHDIIYEEFEESLTNISGVRLKITAKIKNQKVRSFKIDFNDLAHKLQDEKYKKLFIADGWVSDTRRLVEENELN